MKFTSLSIFIAFFVLNFYAIGITQTTSYMTYNIKLDYPKEGPDSWENRKSFMQSQILFYNPDFLGVQEAMPQQMKDLDSLLVDYNYIGVGRDNGSDEGEFSAIFYKEGDYNLLQSSTFWLSETPDSVSMGWDAACNRVCTYGLFENKTTQETFWVFNTHFDHVGVQARANSSRLIMREIMMRNKRNFPVVLMGDFNLEPDAEDIEFILGHMKDSKTIANIVHGPDATFNAFQFDKIPNRRIDYIFIKANHVKVIRYGVLSDSFDGRYPSDHFPVFVELEWNSNAKSKKG